MPIKKKRVVSTGHGAAAYAYRVAGGVQLGEQEDPHSGPWTLPDTESA